MNIGLVLHPYGEKCAGGLGRSIEALAQALLDESPESRFHIYTKGTGTPRFKGKNWEAQSLGSAPTWLLGDLHAHKEVDVMVYFTPVMPVFFAHPRSIVVVHDLAYLEIPSSSLRRRLTNRFLRAVHGSSLRRARMVACVSEYTRRETECWFGIPSDRTHLIYNGILGFKDPASPLSIPQPFFLFAGVMKGRKNIAGIIEAFASFARKDVEGYKLVIAGKGGGAYHESLVALAASLGISDRMVFSGYVEENQLRWLYEHAQALVFPSFVEGFGMPILEAMQLGCPVITSNQGALAEVAGDAALLVDPYRPQDIADAMHTMAQNKDLRTGLITRGRERAALFSWQRSARALLSLVVSTSSSR